MDKNKKSHLIEKAKQLLEESCYYDATEDSKESKESEELDHNELAEKLMDLFFNREEFIKLITQEKKPFYKTKVSSYSLDEKEKDKIKSQSQKVEEGKKYDVTRVNNKFLRTRIIGFGNNEMYNANHVDKNNMYKFEKEGEIFTPKEKKELRLIVNEYITKLQKEKNSVHISLDGPKKSDIIIIGNLINLFNSIAHSLSKFFRGRKAMNAAETFIEVAKYAEAKYRRQYQQYISGVKQRRQSSKKTTLGEIAEKVGREHKKTLDKGQNAINEAKGKLIGEVRQHTEQQKKLEKGIGAALGIQRQYRAAKDLIKDDRTPEQKTYLAKKESSFAKKLEARKKEEQDKGRSK